MFGEQTELYYALAPHKFRSTDSETQESYELSGGVGGEPNRFIVVVVGGGGGGGGGGVLLTEILRYFYYMKTILTFS